MFMRNAKPTPQMPSVDRQSAAYLRVLLPEALMHDPQLEAIRQQMPEGRRCDFVQAPRSGAADSEFLLSLFLPPAELDAIADQVLAARRSGRSTTLIVAINGSQTIVAPAGTRYQIMSTASIPSAIGTASPTRIPLTAMRRKISSYFSATSRNTGANAVEPVSLSVPPSQPGE